MHQKIATALLALLPLGGGCPQPPTVDPVTTVDGLEGGRINGNLQVDSLVAAVVTSGEVVTDSIEVNRDATFAGSITASSVATDAIAVDGALTASSLSVTTGVFNERPSLGGVPLGTDIVGAVGRRQGPSTAATAEGSCADAFSGAHICGEAEFLEALPFFAGSIAPLEGASVRVSAHHSALRVLAGGVERDVVANDCGNWTQIADFEGAITVADGGEELALGVTVMPFAHGRLTVERDDSGRIFLAPSIECAGSAIRFVCCL